MGRYSKLLCLMFGRHKLEHPVPTENRWVSTFSTWQHRRYRQFYHWSLFKIADIFVWLFSFLIVLNFKYPWAILNNPIDPVATFVLATNGDQVQWRIYMQRWVYCYMIWSLPILWSFSCIQYILCLPRCFDHFYAVVFKRQSLMGSGRKWNMAYNRGK